MTSFTSIVMTATFALGALALITGLGFLFIPDTFIKLSRKLDKRFSIEPVIKNRLEKEVTVEEWFKRRRIILGIVSLIVSVVLLSQFFI